MKQLTRTGQRVVKTVISRIDSLIAEGYTRSNAIDKARSDNDHHPSCLVDIALDQPITDGDWESLRRQGYAEE